MKIKVENAYSDGHESVIEYEVPTVDVDAALLGREAGDASHPGGTDELWDLLWTYTGDGHGEDSDLGWSYEVTIIEADDPALVGLSRENSGN